MCRNIKTLFNFEPPVTDDEIRAASLQFVRKLSGFTKPSKRTRRRSTSRSSGRPRWRASCCARSSRTRRRATARSRRRRRASGAKSGSVSSARPEPAAAPRFLRFDDEPIATARRLLGQRLVRVVGGRRVAGLIVEVEAYLGPPDRAAHTWGGRRTPRNESMWQGGGLAYVYFTYGMHHCMNVVCGPAGSGTAVLVRALEPTEGQEEMARRRPAARRATDLCSGPARLAQALAIDRGLDRADLRTGDELWIEAARARALPAERIAAGPRVGVDYAGAWARRRLRFWVRGNPHVSRA